MAGRGHEVLLPGLAPAFSAALIVVLRAALCGKGVRALMQSPTGAQPGGIDTERLHPLMFAAGLVLSGVAGCLLTMTCTISPATVLDHMTATMRIHHEESLGPVKCIGRVDGVDTAVDCANDNEYGLSAAVFGVVKGSGIGRFGGKAGGVPGVSWSAFAAAY